MVWVERERRKSATLLLVHIVSNHEHGDNASISRTEDIYYPEMGGCEYVELTARR